MTPTLTPRTLTQRGRSLIEVMVSLAIGLIVLGGILITTSSSTLSGQRSDAHSRLNEDSQTALAILVPQLRMAGYSSVVTNGSSPINSQRFAGPGVRGCDNGFAAPTGNNQWTGADVGSAYSTRLNCAAGTGAPAIAVLYEADVFNTPPTNGLPSDCLGQQLTQVPSSLSSSVNANDRVFIAENRYYLRRDASTNLFALSCAGSGNASNVQTLVENIQQMTITYGVAEESLVDSATGLSRPVAQTQRYLTATEIDTELAYAADDLDRWRRVVSVRLCITVRSTTQAANAPTAYEACDDTVVTPTDRFLRKTVRATVALRNRT